MIYNLRLNLRSDPLSRLRERVPEGRVRGLNHEILKTLTLALSRGAVEGTRKSALFKY